MRRMKERSEEKKDDSDLETHMISPDGKYASSVRYTERSLSASRRRSKAFPSAVSPASRDMSTKATPKRNNARAAAEARKVEMPTAAPSTPSSSGPRGEAFPAQSAFSDFPFSTPGNDTNVTEEEIVNADQAWSEASTPSVMKDIFHHKAAANIVRLLTPDRMFPGTLPESSGAVFDEENGDSPKTVTANPGLGDSAFGKWNGLQDMGCKNREFNVTPDDEEDIMRKALTTRMIGPSQQLADLLSQIHRDVKITPQISRAYATRRKNACGALKVLSGKEENRLKLCWTTGMLDAISSVLNDVKAPTLDELSFNANTEARNRIVSTLLNLAANKRNRMLICNTAGVLEAVTACIAGDQGESRQGCCMILLQLAKTSETRPLIIRCPGLLDALSKVIEVPQLTPPPSVQVDTPLRNKGYKNPYLAIFESHLSPCQSQILSDPSQSFVSPSDTALSPDDTMYSPGETFADKESIYSREDVITDTEDDDTSVSSYSSSSSKSGTLGSHTEHTEDHTEGHTDSSESDEHSHTDEDESCVAEDVSRGPGSCIIIQSMSEMEIVFRSDFAEEKKEDNDYDADPNQFLHGARLNIFGCLLLMVKSKENAVSCVCLKLCLLEEM